MSSQLDFESFCKDEYFRAFRYIQKHIPGREDAEDLLQNVFMYCYEKLDTFDPEKSSPTTWLYLVINSRLKNYYRDRRETEDISLLEEILPTDGDEAENAVYLDELKSALTAAMETLPERQRLIVKYKYFDGLSHEEIAAKLDITVSNCRVLLTRALDKMKIQMQGFSC